MKKNVLVIGSNGGIGSAVINELSKDDEIAHIFSVSRNEKKHQDPRFSHYMVQDEESEITEFAQIMAEQKICFHQVYCCLGVLHKDDGIKLTPEKRLEDISQEQFLEYFRINTVLPALWLKHLVNLVCKDKAVISIISARVGSISDNRLGGWYGYRSAKAALNMVIKTAWVEYQRRRSNTILISYHPGTVDTELSAPFQGNVKPEKLFTPEFTAERLVDICKQAKIENSPYYIDWDAKSINW
ncbi:SDR family NAD(P)-dependent oxidoreductase [Glaciecola sp. 1036]|uniref:SDR family NAD(P)-dependent oxidoreductase n=1 Tax=Alteromonadaceae TaxID=72275 RepID=UPI003D088031